MEVRSRFAGELQWPLPLQRSILLLTSSLALQTERDRGTGSPRLHLLSFSWNICHQEDTETDSCSGLLLSRCHRSIRRASAPLGILVVRSVNSEKKSFRSLCGVGCVLSVVCLLASTGSGVVIKLVTFCWKGSTRDTIEGRKEVVKPKKRERKEEEV